MSGSVGSSSLVRPLASAFRAGWRAGAGGVGPKIRPSKPGIRQGPGLAGAELSSRLPARADPGAVAGETRPAAGPWGRSRGLGSSSSGSIVSGMGARTDASGVGGVANPPGGRNGDDRPFVASGGGARLKGAAPVIEPPRAGGTPRGLLELPARGTGVVTPGTTSTGLRDEAAIGCGLAGVAGFGAGVVDVSGLGAASRGSSGTVAGPSSGGGS